MTRARISLRRRVMLASLGLGFVLSLLFAGMVYVVTDQYEHIVAGEILRGQAEDYSLRLSTGLPAQLPQTQRISGYRGRSAAPYAALGPGVTELRNGVHVGVYDTRSGRLYFVIDLSDIEEIERYLNAFLILMIVSCTAMAGWLGWWFAGSALSPVGRLASAVDALPTDPRPSRLQDTVSHDELGRLAAAIDAYQERLVDADAQERVFFADASHELRTPLAVIRGVAEVLLDEPAGSQQTSWLQRLDRGVQELTDLLDAMLGMARRFPLEPIDVDAASFLHEALAPVEAAHPDAPILIEATGTLRVPPRPKHASAAMYLPTNRVLRRGPPGAPSWAAAGDPDPRRSRGSGLGSAAQRQRACKRAARTPRRAPGLGALTHCAGCRSPVAARCNSSPACRARPLTRRTG